MLGKPVEEKDFTFWDLAVAGILWHLVEKRFDFKWF